MNIIFDALDNFYPFNDKFSIYLHKIAGRFLGEIIIESMLSNRRGTKYKSIFLKDPALNKSQEFKSVLKRYLTIKDSQPKTAAAYADVYYKSSDTKPLYISYPWDILEIKQDYLAKLKRQISNKAEIEKAVEIDGSVVIEDGVTILNGARVKGNVYIGKKSFIANNALIRNDTSIGRDSIVAYSSDIKDCLMQDRTGIGPLSFFGDSMLGYECFCGGMVRVSNYRLDKKNVKVLIKGKEVDTKKRFLGCFIGNKTSLGIGSIILPGRKLGNNVIIGPNVTVSKNIDSNRKVVLKQSLSIERIDEKG